MIARWLLSKHLEKDETLLLAVHKHWLIGFRALFWPTLILVVSGWILSLNPVRGMLIGMGIWMLIVAIWWLRNFFDYYLDAWLITDQGIIDIAWHGWFHRQSTRVLYSDLQGISYEIHGVFATILRYGTVMVEKISTGQEISLEYVGTPKRVENAILQNQEGYLHSKNMKDAKQVQQLLSTMVAEQMQRDEFLGEEFDSEQGAE